MNGFLKFIIEHIKALFVIIFLLLIVTIGIPFLINWLYKQQTQISFFVAEWEAADALSYYGSVLTFLGTAALSALSLWQNHQIKVGNDKHSALLAQLEKAKNAIHFKIRVVALNVKAENVKITLNNLTENTAYNVTISKLRIIYRVNNTVHWEKLENKTYDYLGPFMEWEIELNNVAIPSSEYYMEFVFSYSDRYGEAYTLRATGIWDDTKNKLHFEITEVK